MGFDLETYNKNIRGLKINCTCDSCGSIFSRIRKEITIMINRNQQVTFCSKKCYDNLTPRIDCNCSNCGKIFSRMYYTRNNKNHFCSHSCSATYNNKHKTKGTRRSKLEVFLETKLLEQYTNLEIHFNRKDAINSELDVYIPSLKLAFELNGILHYEPIYGSDKLSKIQNNDNRKFQACLERGIELCIIDTSSVKYNKEKKFLPFLMMIRSIIDDKS